MARHERAQWARLELDGVALLTDLAAGVSLARAVQFQEPQLHCFGASAASSRPWEHGDFSGRVAQGASCNCSIITLTPHANGTHTESAAHLTVEPLDAYRVIPQRLLVAVLMSVLPERAASCADSTLPEPQPDDELITRSALERAWPSAPAERLIARAAVIRTLPNSADKFAPSPPTQSSSSAPFLSLPAVGLLLERDIHHLVLDVPSADRMQDGGMLSAHRAFFGLPSGSKHLVDAQRRDSTLTELAYIEDAIADGWYLL